MSTRDVVLTVHIAFAALSLGPVALAMSLFPRGLEAMLAGEGASSAQLLVRTTKRYSRVFLVVPATGLWLANNLDAFDLLWVQLALGGVLLIFGILNLIVVPGQARLLAAASQLVTVPAGGVPRMAGDHEGSVWTSASRTGGEIGARVRRLDGFWPVGMSTMAINLTWVAVLGLMVAKPA